MERIASLNWRWARHFVRRPKDKRWTKKITNWRPPKIWPERLTNGMKKIAGTSWQQIHSKWKEIEETYIQKSIETGWKKKNAFQVIHQKYLFQEVTLKGKWVTISLVCNSDRRTRSSYAKIGGSNLQISFSDSKFSVAILHEEATNVMSDLEQLMLKCKRNVRR